MGAIRYVPEAKPAGRRVQPNHGGICPAGGSRATLTLEILSCLRTSARAASGGGLSRLKTAIASPPGSCGSLEEDPVDKVLEHQEAAGYALVAKTATIFDALKAFDQSLHSGTALQAVIVTANGQATETPLGIVTPSDIPGLVRATTLEP
jgi:hypothetical protein